MLEFINASEDKDGDGDGGSERLTIHTTTRQVNLTAGLVEMDKNAAVSEQ